MGREAAAGILTGEAAAAEDPCCCLYFSKKGSFGVVDIGTGLTAGEWEAEPAIEGSGVRVVGEKRGGMGMVRGLRSSSSSFTAASASDDSEDSDGTSASATSGSPPAGLVYFVRVFKVRTDDDNGSCSRLWRDAVEMLRTDDESLEGVMFC